MATFRIEKTRDFTIMSNYHFKDKRLSLKAKGLLSLMLSLPENWDYTTKGLARICKDGVDSIRSGVNELEKMGYVRREYVRDDHGRVRDIEYIISEVPPDNPNLQKCKKSKNKQSERKKKGGNEEQIINDETSCSAETDEFGVSEKKEVREGERLQKRENPVSVNPVSVKPKSDDSVSDNNVLLNTNQLSTNEIYNPPDQIKYETQSTNGNNCKFISSEREEEYRDMICDLIDYDVLKATPHIKVDLLDEIVEIIVETLCMCVQHKYVRVTKTDFPSKMVRDKLMRLEQDHIEYVLLCLEENTSHIKNIKQYILTSLWNATSTINCYYTTRVHHDLYGGTNEST